LTLLSANWLAFSRYLEREGERLIVDVKGVDFHSEKAADELFAKPLMNC